MSLKSAFVSFVIVGAGLAGTLFVSPGISATAPSEPSSFGDSSALSESFDSTEYTTSRGNWSEPEPYNFPESADELNFSDVGKWLSVSGEELSRVPLQVILQETGSGLAVDILGNYPIPLKIALKQEWINRHVQDASLEGRAFSSENVSSILYYAIALPGVVGHLELQWAPFEPETTEALFSLGSSRSISLERPMLVRLAAVPGWSATQEAGADGNASGERSIWSGSLIVEFQGDDHSGQNVTLARRWMESYGIGDPAFRHEDGSVISHEVEGDHVVARVDHFSSVIIDNQEGTTWTETKTGGQSFISAAKSGQTEDAFRSPRRSMEVSFKSGGSGTDYGSVLRYRDFTFTNIEMLRIWFYAERYKHDYNPTWDNLDAGVRLRLYDSGGTNYATFQYWLAAWYHTTDTKTPDANSRLVYGKPPMNKWTEFVGFPKTDWSADWARATRIRIEFYAAAAGTVGDEFIMYFDDFSYGVKTSKVAYIWTGTLQGDQVKTDCRLVSFTVPSAAVLILATLSMPPAGSDFDFSLWDNQGRRTGGWTRADRTTKNEIPNSAYSGIGGKPETVTVDPPGSSGTWKAGCFLSSGNGHYEIRVEVFTTEMLSSDADSTRYYFTVDKPSYFLDVELRFASSNDYDLSIWDTSGRRTGGWIKSDKVSRNNVLYATYSGYTAKPEWIFVDPPADFPLWSAMAYSFSGSGYYEIDARVEADSSFWSANLHDNEVSGSIATARSVFDNHAVPLGVGHIRTDVAWSTVEGAGNDIYNWPAVDFFRTYVSAAKARGIDVIVIMKAPPQWANDLKNVDKPTFFTRWQEYCQFTASELGAYVDYYQILNEENWENTVDDPDLPTMTTRCLTGLSVGEGISEGYHKRYFKTAINANTDIAGDWAAFLRTWVNGASSSTDVLGIDHYPGTKDSCLDLGDWGRLDTLISLVKELSKEGAVMETGYATDGISICAQGPRESTQAAFAEETVSVIFDKTFTHNRDFPRNRILFGNWYNLVDAYGTSSCFESECWFGLLKGVTFQRKPGYGIVRAKVADFGRWSLAQSFSYNLAENADGGVALGDLNSNGLVDAIFMVVDEPSGGDNYYYRVGWDLNPDGTVASWSPSTGMFGPFDAGGDLSDGGGVAIGDVDRNGVLDALFMRVDAPSGPDNYRYRVAFNIITSGASKGQFSTWSAVMGNVQVGADTILAGGVALADIDHNGVLDALYEVVVDNLASVDDVRYRIGWNLATDGTICGTCWSAVKGPVASPTDPTAGGGVTVVDWDGDGSLDLLVMGVYNPATGAGVDNTYRFVIGSTLSTAGDVTGGWSTTWGYQFVPGEDNQGGDLAAGDVDRDGRIDLLFMAVDNPSGANSIRYRLRVAI